MKHIISAVIATLALMAFTMTAFSADASKPDIPAGPVYAVGEIQNDAVKADRTRKDTEAQDAEEKAEADARNAKIKAGKNAKKEKEKANAESKQ